LFSTVPVDTWQALAKCCLVTYGSSVNPHSTTTYFMGWCLSRFFFSTSGREHLLAVGCLVWQSGDTCHVLAGEHQRCSREYWWIGSCTQCVMGGLGGVCFETNCETDWLLTISQFKSHSLRFLADSYPRTFFHYLSIEKKQKRRELAAPRCSPCFISHPWASIAKTLTSRAALPRNEVFYVLECQKLLIILWCMT